jgi:acetylornithine/succinyldiaminopimelate/putrescine aminotransferase
VETRERASTFGANPVAVEAALATLDVVKSEKFIKKCEKDG